MATDCLFIEVHGLSSRLLRPDFREPDGQSNSIQATDTAPDPAQRTRGSRRRADPCYRRHPRNRRRSRRWCRCVLQIPQHKAGSGRKLAAADELSQPCLI